MNPKLMVDEVADRGAAKQRLAGDAGTMWVGGGTELVPLMRAGLVRPRRLVPVRRLGLADVQLLSGPAGPQLRLGAGLTMAAAAAHPLVLQHAPAVAQALRLSASAQVRHMATLGGNLLQHTRCPYWRQASMHCNRVRPGAGCAAAQGEQRHAAIFGVAASDADCVATHASDLAVALLALDAELVIDGEQGEHPLPIDAFYRVPSSADEAPHRLGPTGLITALVLPLDAACAGARFFKVRDRASFQFALVSVAVALTIEAGTVRRARVAAGGVAPRPWRLVDCEERLLGRTLAGPTGPASARDAAELAVNRARALPGNAFKLELLQRLVAHAITAVAAGAAPSPIGVDA